MSKKNFLVGLLVIAALIVIWLLQKPSVTPLLQAPKGTVKKNMPGQSAATSTSIATKPQTEFQKIRVHTVQVKQREEQEILLWQSPLVYYGKVVDESNQPISGVQASYNVSALNGSKEEIQYTGTVTSDERGFFKIDGAKGVGLMLKLSHPNYYSYPENSTGFDKRSLPRKGHFSDSEEKAELFRMHSKGHPVPLIVRSGGFHMQNNGAIANYPLRGNTRADILGNLQFSGWNSLPV